MQLTMSFTIEKVLADARMLVSRLKDHDGAADNLIAVSQTMYRRVDSMRQYQEDLNELNEIARHRPRANLIMGLVQENTQIRELQQENKELKACLEEHQSAIELIMSKYREQMVKLLMANKLDSSSQDRGGNAQLVEQKVDKIVEMAAVMQRAIRVEESESIQQREHIASLETENKTLRELLMIGYSNSGEIAKMEKSIQTENDIQPSASFNSSGNIDTESVTTTDDEDHHFVSNDTMNSSVIENKSFKLEKLIQSGGGGGGVGYSSPRDSVSSNDSSSLNESAERISLNDVTVNVTSTTASPSQQQEQQNQSQANGAQSNNVSATELSCGNNQEKSVQESSVSSSSSSNSENCVDHGNTRENGDENSSDSYDDSTIKNIVPTSNCVEEVDSGTLKANVSKDVNANRANSPNVNSDRENNVDC